MKDNTRRDFLKKSVVAAGFTAGLLTNTNAKPTKGGADSKSDNPSQLAKTYLLKRQIPAEETYDVVVAGGGPSGVAAAVSAARLGANVILIEAMGCLGGMGTSGLVSAFDPMANGEKQLVKGFMGEVVETMHNAGFMNVNPDAWREKYHSWSKFNPEGYKLVLDQKTQQAGVKVLFFSRVIEADVDSDNSRVNGVVINNIEGMKYLKANAFIDCTGDAVLAHLCGADCWRAGRDTENIMPPTMATLWNGEVNLSRDEIRKLYYEWVKKGLHQHPSKKIVGLSEVDDNLFYLNGGHLFGVDALDANSLSEGAMRGRVIADDFRKMFEAHPKIKLALAATSSLVGVRESRRIKGEYVFNKDDMATRRIFPDSIGVYCKACDIHPYAFTDQAMKDHYEMYYLNKLYRPDRGEMFSIPYGALVPKGWKNLWTAGRCASADVIGQGSLRCQPYCSQMGQAAGTAAVQAMLTGQAANNLDTEQLVSTLREAGVYLPQKQTSKQMTKIKN
tara:strand:+ start:993 stop:2501 length:1509 start_codon:yes stop_codon:yes gene_type:complete